MPPYVDPLGQDELARQQQGNADELESSTYDNHGISNNPTPWQQILIPILGWAGGMALGAALGGGAGAVGGGGGDAIGVGAGLGEGIPETGIGLGATAIPGGAAASLPSAAPILTGAGVGSKILNGISKVAPVLGQAAGGRAAAQQANDQSNTQRANILLKAPSQRMANAARANLLKSGPTTVDWGGPGSGSRGQTVKFGDGIHTPMPDMGTIPDDIVHQELSKAMNGEDLPKAGHSSALDNILGYGATAANILGALRK